MRKPPGCKRPKLVLQLAFASLVCLVITLYIVSFLPNDAGRRVRHGFTSQFDRATWKKLYGGKVSTQSARKALAELRNNRNMPLNVRLLHEYDAVDAIYVSEGWNVTVDIATAERLYRNDTPRFKQRHFSTEETMRYGYITAQRMSLPLPCPSTFKDVSIKAAARYLVESAFTAEAWQQRDDSTETILRQQRELYAAAWNSIQDEHTLASFQKLALPPGTNPCKRLVVATSTLPSRIHRLAGFLHDIKRQTVQPDYILLGIPPFSTRLKSLYTIPDWISQDPFVRIVDLPLDFGPLSKLITGIIGENDEDSCIITFDDDGFLESNVIEGMVSWAAVLPNAALGYSGWNKTCIDGMFPYSCPMGDKGYMYIRPISDYMCSGAGRELYSDLNCYGAVTNLPRAADVLQGAHGILFRRGMFEPQFLRLPTHFALQRIEDMVDLLSNETSSSAENITRAARGVLKSSLLSEEDTRWLSNISPSPGTFLVDDVYIAAYLASKGVVKWVLPTNDYTNLPVVKVNATGRHLPILFAEWNEAELPPLRTIDALHATSDFDLANYEAVRLFRFLGWW